MFLRYVLSVLLLLPMVLGLVGCFKTPGNPGTANNSSTSVPITPVYKSANSSYLLAEGPCLGSNMITFTYSSPLTSSKTVDGTCSDDKISVHLDISAGDMEQRFSVSIVARVGNSHSNPYRVTVNYTPPPPPSPNFAVVTGGGVATGGDIMVNATTGEPFSPGSQSGGSITSRSGLQGVLDP